MNGTEERKLLGENIRGFRKGKISQKKLGEQIGVSRELVGKWEKANKFPLPEYINKISVALSLSQEEREKLIETWSISLKALTPHMRTIICNKCGITKNMEQLKAEDLKELF